MGRPDRRTLVRLVLALAAVGVAIGLLLRGHRDRGAAPVTAEDAAEARRGSPAGPSRAGRASATPGAPAAAPGVFRLEGAVVSAASGEGVPGAEITFQQGDAAASMRADAAGHFVFETDVAGTWQLRSAQARGFLPLAAGRLSFRADPGGRVSGVVVSLEPELEIRGRVVDPEERPVPGARVTLLGDEPAHPPVVADADGRFTIGAASGVLEARADGWGPGRAPIDLAARLGSAITIRLTTAAAEPGSIAGRVVDPSGAAAAGAHVSARWAGAFSERHAAARDTSAGDGTFRLEGLDPGDHSVTAEIAELAPAFAEPVATGTRDLVLRLGAGASLTGTVRDASTGEGIPVFAVTVFRGPPDMRRSVQRAATFADPAGRFTLGGLAPEEAVAVAAAPGYAPAELQVRPGAADVEFRLARGGSVSGVVLDGEDHMPLVGARVELEGDASITPAWRTGAGTDARGRFTLEGLPLGRALLLGAARGHHARAVSAEVGDPHVVIELTRLRDGEEPGIELTGIGAGLSIDGDGEALLVAEVQPTGGAAAAGLAAGDRILAVEGRPVAELGFAGCIGAIRGPEGMEVTLTVQRGMEPPRPVRVTRLRIRG